VLWNCGADLVIVGTTTPGLFMTGYASAVLTPFKAVVSQPMPAIAVTDGMSLSSSRARAP